MGGELGWRWRWEADLFESFGEGLGCYAACGRRVEDFKAGAQSVEEGGWEGGVSAGAAGWGCGSGWATLRVVALLFW